MLCGAQIYSGSTNNNIASHKTEVFSALAMYLLVFLPSTCSCAETGAQTIIHITLLSCVVIFVSILFSFSFHFCHFSTLYLYYIFCMFILITLYSICYLLHSNALLGFVVYYFQDLLLRRNWTGTAQGVAASTNSEAAFHNT